MIISDLYNYLEGSLEITAEGRRLEPFLNLCSVRGLRLREVTFQGDRLRARICLEAFRRIRPVARQTRTRVRIRRRNGLPFIMRRAAGRKPLLAGAVFFLFCLYYLSTLVWFVEIRGSERLDPDAVLGALSEIGLRPGIRKSGLDTDEIEQNLELRFPDLAQALVTINGTRALVVLVEKAPVPAKNNRTPADLLAAKSGVVERLVVVTGQAAVKEGEAVRAGQTVVRGILEPKVPGQPGAVGEPVPVRAKGEVFARVWYQEYREVPLRFPEKVRTGRAYRRQIIKAGGWDIITWGRGPVPFSDYEVEESGNSVFSWRNPLFSVEKVTSVYFELLSRPGQRDVREAVELAEAGLAREVLDALPGGSQILSVRSRVLQSTLEMAGIMTTVETLEDIGILADSQ